MECSVKMNLYGCNKKGLGFTKKKSYEQICKFCIVQVVSKYFIKYLHLNQLMTDLLLSILLYIFRYLRH